METSPATPSPIRADIGASRYVLPMSTGIEKIKPGQTAMITSRPQRLAFRPERVFISDYSPRMTIEPPTMPEIKLKWYERIFGGGNRRLEAQLAAANAQLAALSALIVEFGNRRGACDWLVNDIVIGNRSQFAQSGALPGDMFSSSAIGNLMTFETAQTAMDVVMVVTYRGPVKEGVEFHGSIVGTAAEIA